MDYSVIIPVYQGEKTLPILTKRIVDFFATHHFSFEIIFVADAPKDASVNVIEQLIKTSSEKILLLELDKNCGQHTATICGIEKSAGDFIFTIDEDLQHSPEDFLALITKQKKENADVVYGIYKKRNHSWFRNFTSWFSKKMFIFFIPNFFFEFTSFRLIKHEIAKKCLLHNDLYPFVDGILSMETKVIFAVEVNQQKKKSGKSGYSFQKLFFHFVKIILSFSFLKKTILKKFIQPLHFNLKK